MVIWNCLDDMGLISNQCPLKVTQIFWFKELFSTHGHQFYLKPLKMNVPISATYKPGRNFAVSIRHWSESPCKVMKVITKSCLDSTMQTQHTQNKTWEAAHCNCKCFIPGVLEDQTLEKMLSQKWDILQFVSDCYGGNFWICFLVRPQHSGLAHENFFWFELQAICCGFFLPFSTCGCEGHVSLAIKLGNPEGALKDSISITNWDKAHFQGGCYGGHFFGFSQVFGFKTMFWNTKCYFGFQNEAWTVISCFLTCLHLWLPMKSCPSDENSTWWKCSKTLRVSPVIKALSWYEAEAEFIASLVAVETILDFWGFWTWNAIFVWITS